MKFVSALFLLLFFWSCNAIADPIIVQKPISFDAERIKLTQAYRKQHYGIDQPTITIIPQMIVLHWTASDSLQKSFDFFNPDLLTNRPDISSGGELNVSAHFLVDRDGTIYQLMPTNWMARHIIGLNNIALGIENVGGADDKQNLTAAQVAADTALIQKLVREYPTIHYLIGHFEYDKFRNSALWEDKDPHYFTKKHDPGADFMQQVRAKVADLKLQSEPPAAKK